MAIVGRTFAVADLKYVRFSGFPAWLLWIGVHIYFLIGFANRLLVMMPWGNNHSSQNDVGFGFFHSPNRK
jgi:NADH:ubiquinone reductase (H+-translocating)